MKQASVNRLRNDTRRLRSLVRLLALMLLMQASLVLSQQIAPTWEDLRGKVVDEQGHPVSDVTVQLRVSGGKPDEATKSDDRGGFLFRVLADGVYEIVAEKAGRHGEIPVAARQSEITVVLGGDPSPAASGTAMEFADQPHFSVAGVTDWTAAGGHGSDTILRTSESLTNAAVALKSDASPTSTKTATDLTKSMRADAYRLAARQDEVLGDPLRAVQEFEQAATLDPSEQNEFEWASELLLHRAIWQAEQVFRKGTEAYPTSMRMQAGFGAALFAGSRYKEAAFELCKASDLDPSATSPYISLGEIEIAAPDPLECVKTRLGRFVNLRPESAVANYLYAMALLKSSRAESKAPSSSSAKEYLNKAISLDATYAEAYLQLGVLAAAQNDAQGAIKYYLRAIQVSPTLADAHYRLGIAYDRVGERAKAQQEFALHEQIKQKQAVAVDDQRKTIKQFLFAKPEDSTVGRVK